MSFGEFRKLSVTFLLLGTALAHLPATQGRPLNEPHRRFPEVARSDEDLEDVMATDMSGMTDMPGMSGMPEMSHMPGMSGMPELSHMPGMTGMPEMSGMPEMTMPGMDMDMNMKMYFHKSEHATILFQKWHTMTWQEMVGSCIGLGIIAALYEGFKVAREVINRKQSPRSQPSEIYASDNKGFNAGSNGNFNNHNNISFDDGRVDDGCCNPKCGMCSGWHWLQTFLHIIQVFVSYCLMLVFMTYNAWLCIAVVLGAGVGYFFFGWLKHDVLDPNEHCH